MLWGGEGLAGSEQSAELELQCSAAMTLSELRVTLSSQQHNTPSYNPFSLPPVSLSEVSEATATLGPRYNAQFPMQHVPDYRQNVYIPGSTATLTANPQQMMPQPALQGPPQAIPQVDVPNAAQTPASKKKSTKKDKK